MATIIPQRYETVSLDQVRPHPDNPNEGNVAAIGESIADNGFFGALIIQKSTGRILAGNHRYLAAQDAGLDQLPAIVVDVDDDRARRIMLVDNRAAQLASWDDEQLLGLLEELNVSPAGITGTGFTPTDLEDLAAVLAAPPSPDELAQRHGEPDEKAMAPEIRLKVTAELFDRWRAALDRHVGEDDVAKLDRLLADVEARDG